MLNIPFNIAGSAAEAPWKGGDTSGADCVETASSQRFTIDTRYRDRYFEKLFGVTSDVKYLLILILFLKLLFNATHPPQNIQAIRLPRGIVGKFNKAKSNRARRVSRKGHFGFRFGEHEESKKGRRKKTKRRVEIKRGAKYVWRKKGGQ